MLNRPVNLSLHQTTHDPSFDGMWRVDGNPPRRLFLLFVFIVLPLVAVAIRLSSLQLAGSGRFDVAIPGMIEEFEPIPCRDGRILGSDGRVLACDVERFTVQMHYRWLEEPADPQWLRQRAYAQLTPDERRDATLVARTEKEIGEKRLQMWRRLAALADIPLAELDRRRHRVQKRIERIVSLVEEQRERDGHSGPASQTATSTTPSSSTWWRTMWHNLVHALTTPPERSRREPIIVREELDYHMLISSVSLDAAAEIESHPELFPGLRCGMTTQRVYPEGKLAAHLIGTRGVLDADDWRQTRPEHAGQDPLDFQPGQVVGKTGVEAAYAAGLHGVRGLRRVIKNRRGEIIHEQTVREARLGHDVTLTLSMPLQEQAEAILASTLQTLWGVDDQTTKSKETAFHGGAIVALDVRTGEVLAAASAPTFDPNDLLAPSPEVWNRLLSNPAKPLFFRVTQMTLPPGSVFKPLTAIATLQTGASIGHDSIYCRGYLDHPDRFRCYIYRRYGYGHGDVTLVDALCESCNVFFFTAARAIGPEPITQWADRFGFGRVTGIDVPGERPGHVPGPGGNDAFPSDTTWNPGDTLSLAIGQSRLTVTPLQVARMMAAIANGGYLVTPHIVRQTDHVDNLESARGLKATIHASYYEPRRIPGLSEQTLRRVREGLRRVVEDRRGTGHKTVHLDGLAVAGKTGTAEVGNGQPDHAWFAGYAPADRPRVAFAVVLEHAGSGGHSAGPVARQLLQAMLDVGLLQRTQLAAR